MAAMLENIRNVVTRLPMHRFGRNLGGCISVCPRHVRRDVVAMEAERINHKRMKSGKKNSKC